MRQHRVEAKMRVAIRSFLSGKTPTVETCLLLQRESYGIKGDLLTEEDCRFLRAVNSETDHLPVGKLQENWHPDVLPQKLAELASYDVHFKQETTELCTRLMVSLKERQKARIANLQTSQTQAEAL